MAQDLGHTGSAYIGANQIAEITSWDVTFDGNPVDVTSFGDTYEEGAYTITSVSGSFSGFGDKSDTTGQNALIDQFLDGGTKAAVFLYLYVSGAVGYYGNALVTPTKSAQAGTAVQQFSSSFQGTGTWYQNIG